MNGFIRFLLIQKVPRKTTNEHALSKYKNLTNDQISVLEPFGIALSSKYPIFKLYPLL